MLNFGPGLLEDCAAGHYDPTATYVYGDVVIYDGKLYRNINSATSTTGVFYMPGNWEETNIVDVFRSIRLQPSSPIGIPSVGDSVSYSMPGLTPNHSVVLWNFSLSAENVPPTQLSIETGFDMFTITNNGVLVNETVQPLFIWGKTVTCTEIVEQGS